MSKCIRVKKGSKVEAMWRDQLEMNNTTQDFIWWLNVETLKQVIMDDYEACSFETSNNEQ